MREEPLSRGVDGSAGATGAGAGLLEGERRCAWPESDEPSLIDRNHPLRPPSRSEWSEAEITQKLVY